MTTMLDTYKWVPELNRFMSDRLLRVSEIINDYEPSLFIAPIPDEIRNANPEKSHALVHEAADGTAYVVRTLAEEEINENLLAWVIAHDNKRTDVIGQLEAKDAANRLVALKTELEKREEMKEIGQTILNSPLHTFRHNGKTYR